MLKKILILLVLVTGISQFAVSTVVMADKQINGVTGVVPTQATWASGNVGMNFKGTLTDAGRIDFDSATTTLDLRYELTKNGTTIDLNKFVDTDRKESVCTVNAKKVKEGESGYNDFTCATLDENLVPGTYAYVIGGDGSVNWNAYMQQDGFVVTKTVSNTPKTSITFGSVVSVTPHQLDATSTGGGYDVAVSMNISNVPSETQMLMRLGTASQVGNTSNYLCLANGPSSVVQPVPAIGVSPQPVIFKLKVSDGNYCVSVQQDIGSGFFPILITSGSDKDLDSAGFFTARGAIVHVGDATPLAPGATNDPAANPTGCVTNSDNSNYCMLAPLPGLGDGTGNLDVSKGFGDYILTIIKIVMGLIGVLSVVMIVFGGIEYMTGVSAGEKEGGKSRIWNAIIGLLLALSSYIILNTLNPKLVSLGVTIPSVQVTADVDTFTPTSGGGTYTGGGSASNVTENITKYDSFLAASAAKYHVECTLMKAFMYAESKGVPDATSGVGAKGLIQLMPATFTGLGYDISLITDPATNIDAATKYVSNLSTTACNGASSNKVCNASDNQYKIAAYNGGGKANGLSTVCQKGQSIDTTAWKCTLNAGYGQTRNYVPKVLNNYQKLKDNSWGC